MATRIGLEPTTPSVTGWCSNQLSYRAMIAQVRGVLTAGTLTIIPEKPCVVKQYFQKKTNYFARVVLFRLTRAGVCQSKCPEGGARLPQAVGRGMECPSLAWQSSPERTCFKCQLLTFLAAYSILLCKRHHGRVKPCGFGKERIFCNEQIV